MTEPSPNPAPEHDMDAPFLNGEAQMQQQLADVEMADSTSDQPPQAEPSPPSQAPPLQQPTTTQTQPLTPSQTTTTPSAPAPSAPVAHPATAPASSRNSPHPPAQAPTQPIPHGSPTRVYLNQHVTPYLLEAMKHLATQEPEKPLKWLSEFLAQKSAEVEGA
ncbi:hypothetical protein GGP41_005286 [Bipolaris sorokiniana]|uniref:Uncharacterized protein n=2 Tax=Cochliobolus sativus TaxID=45130 RepID=A0A8H5ZKN0_COCSA|nr:uncharacterized protein COCSADRAFT_172662 [Bipolaris sorokiniana ND90Pr]EMD63280.1 hypothetical protein COCSADRAFT_172662 [Bipolaris sorokiniana ND90Pr]KAF5849845.1 hypothetical protein GGP41_005286 [Bipolaris sorokiniana]